MTKYSWKNVTKDHVYIWEDKELLDNQRLKGDICVNVEIDVNISKKRILKGASKAMINRLNK